MICSCADHGTGVNPAGENDGWVPVYQQPHKPEFGLFDNLSTPLYRQCSPEIGLANDFYENPSRRLHLLDMSPICAAKRCPLSMDPLSLGEAHYGRHAPRSLRGGSEAAPKPHLGGLVTRGWKRPRTDVEALSPVPHPVAKRIATLGPVSKSASLGIPDAGLGLGFLLPVEDGADCIVNSGMPMRSLAVLASDDEADAPLFSQTVLDHAASNVVNFTF